METLNLGISVIIPAHNSAGTIERALESIIWQSKLPMEVVLVDDASQDNTLEAARSFWQRLEVDFPLRIVTLPENRGPASARNAGWDVAEGDLLAFLDSDDSWHRRKLELQAAGFADDADMVLSGHPAVVEPATDWQASDPTGATSVISFKRLLWRNWFPTPSVMLRREITHRFPADQYLAEDYYLWLLIASDGGKCVRHNSPLCALHKPAYGASGLSESLVAMQRAEASNFRQLKKQGRLSMMGRLLAEGASLLRLSFKAIKLLLSKRQGSYS